MNTGVALFLGLLFGSALIAFVAAFFDRDEPEQIDLSLLRPHDYDDKNKRVFFHPGRAGFATAVAVVAAVVTTWPVFGLALGAAAYGLPVFFAGDGYKDHVGRTDAIAYWVESLRDSMSQARTVEGALRETSLNAPVAIAPELHRFVEQVDHGVLMSDALVQLSDELNHSVSDTALAALVMALKEGSSGVQPVLNQVAETCRRMAADSNEVYASRASSRAVVKMIISIVLIGTLLFVLVFRSYLEPYGTAQGQFVLAVVMAWFGFCGWWVTSLAKYRPAERMIRPGRLVEQQ